MRAPTRDAAGDERRPSRLRAGQPGPGDHVNQYIGHRRAAFLFGEHRRADTQK